MPKKFGVNTKKEEARERKKQKKVEERQKKEKEIEDAYWEETDPKILQKKAEKKRKEQEKLEKQRKKQEAKEALEQEEKELMSKGNQYKLKPPTKREINEFEEKRIKELLKEHDKKENENPIDDINVDEPYINPNYGKLEKKTKDGISIIEASGIDNALQEMKIEDYDKHPEKRMRQAWNDFFEKKLPNYKEEYPNLKRSQYIDMIQKEFKTSIENPVYLANIQKAKKNLEEEDEKE